jgi:hypothetical protein
MMSETTKAIRKTKNRTFAMLAAPAATPVKPKMAATMAMMANV